MEREVLSARDIVERAGGIDAFLEQNIEYFRTAPPHRTFEEIIAIEPRVKALFDEIPSIMQEDDAPQRLWSKIKMRLYVLVGWEAENRAVSGDWDLAFKTLLAEAERCNPNL
jgi:hypothetical protein